MDSFFPPFEPEQPAERPRRFRPVPLRILLPNLVTLLALCAGLTALRMALEGKLELAVYAIVAAAILDGLDGRLARMLRGTSRFGAELDSLADFVNFGVAPGVMLYAWSLHDLKSVGWIGVLVFAIAAALRLARFNVTIEAPKPDYAQEFFVGVPAPAGALILLTPLYFGQLGIPSLPLSAPLTWAFCVFIALLMVSRLPTWSPKRWGKRVPREMVAPLFFAGVLLVALLISYPWECLAVGSVLYMASLPLAWRRYHQLEAAHKREEAIRKQTAAEL